MKELVAGTSIDMDRKEITIVFEKQLSTVENSTPPRDVAREDNWSQEPCWDKRLQ